MLRSRGSAAGRKDRCQRFGLADMQEENQQFGLADMQEEKQWDLMNLVHFQVNLSFQLGGSKSCS